MLARTRLFRQTPRAACIRSLAHKAGSVVPKTVPEGAAAAGFPPTGGESKKKPRTHHGTLCPESRT